MQPNYKTFLCLIFPLVNQLSSLFDTAAMIVWQVLHMHVVAISSHDLSCGSDSEDDFYLLLTIRTQTFNSLLSLSVALVLGIN